MRYDSVQASGARSARVLRSHVMVTRGSSFETLQPTTTMKHSPSAAGLFVACVNHREIVRALPLAASFADEGGLPKAILDVDFLLQE